MRKLAVFKLFGGAKAPKYGSRGAAGMDIYSNESVWLWPLSRKLIHTGTELVVCPHGTYLRVAPRSKLANKLGLNVLAGVVDNDYRGEICVILHNTSWWPVKVVRHTAIAQLITEKLEQPLIQTTGISGTSSRGSDGILSKEDRFKN